MHTSTHLCIAQASRSRKPANTREKSNKIVKSKKNENKRHNKQTKILRQKSK